jgi:hypothetical protein
MGQHNLQTFVILALVMTMLVSCSIGRCGTVVRTIPKEINGWVADVEVRTYDRKTLFKYIDGGAELYLAYSFRKVAVYTYTKKGEPEIIMGIYDMGSAEDAFGVFTSEREGNEIGIGQGSEYDAGLLRFYKGRFFVSIYSLARAVADTIQAIGERPTLLSSLSRKGLIENSIRYFSSHIILNLHYYIANENILLLDGNTRAVLARYSAEEGKPYLLLVQYPSEQRAKKAFSSFLNAYMPEARQTYIVRTENGKWTATFLHSMFVVVVFDAPSQEYAQSVLKAVRVRLEVHR